jgi:hypothetical protein
MHSHLKTRAIRWNEPATRALTMMTPDSALQSGAGPACNSSMPSPIAIRSAARFTTFATINAASRTATTNRNERGNLRRISLPKLSPVAWAIRSQISCVAVINGSVTMDVHSIP